MACGRPGKVARHRHVRDTIRPFEAGRAQFRVTVHDFGHDRESSHGYFPQPSACRVIFPGGLAQRLLQTQPPFFKLCDLKPKFG